MRNKKAKNEEKTKPRPSDPESRFESLIVVTGVLALIIGVAWLFFESTSNTTGTIANPDVTLNSLLSSNTVDFYTLATLINGKTGATMFSVSYAGIDEPLNANGTIEPVLFNFTYRKYYSNVSYMFAVPQAGQSAAEIQVPANVFECASSNFAPGNQSSYNCTAGQAPIYSHFVSALFGIYDLPNASITVKFLKTAKFHGAPCYLVRGVGVANVSTALGTNSTQQSGVYFTACLSQTYYAPLNLTEEARAFNGTVRIYNAQEVSIGTPIRGGTVSALLGVQPTTTTVTSTTTYLFSTSYTTTIPISTTTVPVTFAIYNATCTPTLSYYVCGKTPIQIRQPKYNMTFSFTQNSHSTIYNTQIGCAFGANSVTKFYPFIGGNIMKSGTAYVANNLLCVGPTPNPSITHDINGTIALNFTYAAGTPSKLNPKYAVTIAKFDTGRVS